MLDDIRAAGETIPDECEVFNANLEMSGDDVMFEDVIEIIDRHYEDGLIAWKNGDIYNEPGENVGSAKVLSYAALSGMDKEETLKVSFRVALRFGEEEVGEMMEDEHANVRVFFILRAVDCAIDNFL